MGTEISHQKETASTYEGSMTPTFRNNYRPLRFHRVHGDNVKLSKNDSIATRAEGFCKAIVFSDRPVTVEERVFVRFAEVSANWSGSLRIGFTRHDPVSMKTKLPRYACPDLTSLSGNWAKAIVEKMARHNAVLHFYVDRVGDVHYGIDKQEHGVFFGGVNTTEKLWAVLDIYGNTIAVELVDPLTHTPHDEIFTSPSYSISNNTPFFNQVSDTNSSLYFHSVHGKHISVNGTFAKRTRDINLEPAYIFTNRPVRFNETVLVQIIQANFTGAGNLVYGITSCDPSTLVPSDFPFNPDDLVDRPEYWVVKRDDHPYQVGQGICCTINNEGEVRVKRTTQSQCSTFYVDPTQRLWLFLNIGGSIGEVGIKSVANELLNSLDIDEAVKKFSNLMVSLPTSTSIPEGAASGQQSVSECVICCEEVDCALYRCGHMCMCYECAMKMWNNGVGTQVQCPICRGVIKDVIKIYR